MASYAFNGSNGAAFDSDYLVNSASATGSSSTIQSNKGRHNTGTATGYAGKRSDRWVPDHPRTDSLIRCDYTIASTGIDGTVEVWLRAGSTVDNGSDGYLFVVSYGNDEISLYKAVSFTYTELDVDSYVINDATTYQVRISLAGTAFKASMWESVDPGDSWTLSAADSAITTSGSIHFHTGGGSAAGFLVDWDNIDVSDPAAASGTASLTLAASGAAAGAATGSGSLTLSGSAATVVPTSGAASLTLTGSGTARAAASGTAALTLTGSASTNTPASGGGSLTLTAAGSAAAAATGSGSLTLSGSGSAKAAAAGSGSITLTGAGSSGVPATGAASLSLSGSGTASARASGAAALTLTGTGTARAATTGSGAITLTGTASGGPTPVTGTASITLTATGHATGGTAPVDVAAAVVSASRPAVVSSASRPARVVSVTR